MENISKDAIKELKRIETIQARKDQDTQFYIDRVNHCLEIVGMLNDTHMRICDEILKLAGMICDKTKDDINFK